MKNISFTTKEEVIAYLEALPKGRHPLIMPKESSRLLYNTVAELNPRYKRILRKFRYDILNGDEIGELTVKVLCDEILEPVQSREDRTKERQAIDNMVDRVEFPYSPSLLSWVRFYIYSHKRKLTVSYDGECIVVTRREEKRAELSKAVRQALMGPFPMFIPCEKDKQQNVRSLVSQLSNWAYTISVMSTDGGCVLYRPDKLIEEAKKHYDFINSQMM